MPQVDSFRYVLDTAPVVFVAGLALLDVRRPWVRRWVLIVLSTYALAVIAPRIALLHVLYWCVVAVLHEISVRSDRWKAGYAAFVSCLVIAIAPLVVWKVWPRLFTIDTNLWGNRLLRHLLPPAATLDFSFAIVVPIGVSFVTFRAIDLLIKSRIGMIGRQSPGRVVAYGLFAPILLVGPIAEYEEVLPALDGNRPVTPALAGECLLLLTTGLFKVFALALPLQWSARAFTDYPVNGSMRLDAALVAFTAYFALNFSGYSDIAIAMGRWLGAPLRPNFDRPFVRTDPAAFWNHWHISLTRFLQRNVFTPLGGTRPRRTVVATLVTMLLIGLWHELAWGAALFGLYHGISLVAHRAVSARRPAHRTRALSVVKPVLVFGWFAVSLPLLMLPTGEIVHYYRALVPVI
jgi:D-alanyl-lipoteichoic acid acyltransferase DltB (MBOAT superfamily)